MMRDANAFATAAMTAASEHGAMIDREKVLGC
jgi:hypothetical protein